MNAHEAWVTVMGQRTPATVVAEFDLRDPSERGVDEWVRLAVSGAVTQAPPDERDALQADLDEHAEFFRQQLTPAIEALAVGDVQSSQCSYCLVAYEACPACYR